MNIGYKFYILYSLSPVKYNKIVDSYFYVEILKYIQCFFKPAIQTFEINCKEVG